MSCCTYSVYHLADLTLLIIYTVSKHNINLLPTLTHMSPKQVYQLIHKSQNNFEPSIHRKPPD